MSVKITYPQNAELTREQLYRHTVARGDSLKTVEDGTEIIIKEIVCYETEEGAKILSILDTANHHYVSNSSIFRDELAKIVEIFGDTGITIRIRHYITKTGRMYVTCELA